MYSYRDQLEIVQQIRIAEGDHKTLDCPFCGGRKKFTLDRLATGELLWNCFRASCNAKGRFDGERSIAGAKAYLAARDGKSKRMVGGLPVPSFTTRIEHSDEVCEYLRTVNSLTAYETGLIRIKYAPREKRVLFYNQDDTGAVGRAMYELGATGPKWMTYGDVSKGIHVGNGSDAIIVEDAASACAISQLGEFTGVALLGTSISSALKSALHNYINKFIILDNDASSKALRLTKKLRGSVYIRITNQDLKYLGPEQIRSLINNDTTNEAII